MKSFTSIIFLAVLLLYAFPTRAKDYLKQCWQQQVKPQQNSYLTFSYEEQLNELYHSAEPWMKMDYSARGTVSVQADHFQKQDTLVNGKRTLYSKTQWKKDELLYVDYGRKELSVINTDMLGDQLIETGRYAPVNLIYHFYLQQVPQEQKEQSGFATFKATINKTVVTLYIRKSDNLVAKITTLANDDLHGDVLTSFNYSNYVREDKLTYHRSVTIEKMNGRLKDEVVLSKAIQTDTVPALLDRPADYTLKNKEREQPEIKTEKFNDNIHFINFVHAGTRAMVVEFSDFLLVAEAPLTPGNGELLIQEAQKLAPGKPIRYFTFGHHHPHYIGGMRSFIHKGTTVLSVKADEAYLQYLATAPHTLQPDSLQIEPRPLKLAEIKDSFMITDGKFAMNIYHIGQQSGHTTDYMIYYFPKEKILFEGDLVWIENKGEPKKAGPTQSGLYNAVKALGIPVNTIVQSWGIAFEGYKMMIPFEDMEQSMNIK